MKLGSLPYRIYAQKVDEIRSKAIFRAKPDLLSLTLDISRTTVSLGDGNLWLVRTRSLQSLFR